MNRKRSIIISIRAQYVDEILRGYKRIEYRKRFPQYFKGVCAIYESGPDSRHKVVAQFLTDGIAKYDPETGITKELKECFRNAGASKIELDELRALCEPIYCIPIYRPKETFEMTLQEFSKRYKTEPAFERPPQSWQWFTFKKEAKDGKK